MGTDWPGLIPFREESEEASGRSWSDDGMKVVINNWRKDGQKEEVDDWSGLTMDYLISAALHTQRCPLIQYVGDTDITGWIMEGEEKVISGMDMCSVTLHIWEIYNNGEN